MSDRRLTQKEIKHDIREDRTAVFIETMADRVIENRKTLTLIGVGIAVVVLIAFVVTQMMARQAVKANEALQQAMAVYSAPVEGEEEPAADPNAPPKRGVETFPDRASRQAEAKTKLEEAHQRSGAAGDVAGLYLAEIAVENGDTARARELWQSFVDQHGDHILAQSARLNLLSLDRQEGRAEEVVSTLEAELNKSKSTLPKDVMLWELARTLESLDRDEDAKVYYQRILDEHAASPYASEARTKAGESATASS